MDTHTTWSILSEISILIFWIILGSLILYLGMELRCVQEKEVMIKESL